MTNNLRIGTRVKVISSLVDFRFFRKTETGTIIKNSGQYLGIVVRFDKPMIYEDGYKCHEHNFNAKDLEAIEEYTDFCI